MSNQVYRNPYNGGNKYLPQITKNIYKLPADIEISQTTYGVNWTGLKWVELNGSIVSVNPAAPNKLLYIPAPATVDEIRPESDTTVDAGVTYFYVMESADYHIEFTTVWKGLVPGSHFIGIQVQTYNPVTLVWDTDPIVHGAKSGLQVPSGNPLVIGLQLNIYLGSNQRFKAVCQTSNNNIIEGAHANLVDTNLIISRN